MLSLPTRIFLAEIQFKLGHPLPPESVCSLPCEVGQAKKYVEGERCCWHCFNCTQYQVCDLIFAPQIVSVILTQNIFHSTPDNLFASNFPILSPNNLWNRISFSKMKKYFNQVRVDIPFHRHISVTYVE